MKNRLESAKSGALTPDEVIRDVAIHRQLLDDAAQRSMVDDLRAVVQQAPLFSPMTPYGKPMRVRMSSAGRYGWFSDRTGYRYEPRHPGGTAWPPIPDSIIGVWDRVTGLSRRPDCCLINFYDADARMGLHQDRDEADFSFPVVSISLGDDGLFRLGNLTRGGKTESTWLGSGDVVVMGGDARLIYHGIDRIRAGTSALLPQGGRINLTLRVVD
ncbi:alpha-ketoglutarate-dependent dioxygenase AlkB family protein [Actibacterium ureilyticum]|uniref:alpha-ketoglutarate-dependent dioxygenase AlkB family protein n=1 Tax=Actibacterium ureilyticum TaxID=1590614 RepID=UPI000BAAC311|nr:alpha-ketoglutarate-dependent dioxygenase AlkB [Actibacterium ureilyticum]